MYGWAIDIVTFLLLIVTMVLIVKKHVKGLNIAWKLLAVVPLLMFINPILQVAVSNAASMKKYAGNEVAGLPSNIPAAPTPAPPSSPPLISVSSPFSRYSITSWPQKTFFAATSTQTQKWKTLRVL